MTAGLKVGRNWRLGYAWSDLGYVSQITDSELTADAFSAEPLYGEMAYLARGTVAKK
jgi:hypothetical protein